jgi:hypothetical protein
MRLVSLFYMIQLFNLFKILSVNLCEAYFIQKLSTIKIGTSNKFASVTFLF